MNQIKSPAIPKIQITQGIRCLETAIVTRSAYSLSCDCTQWHYPTCACLWLHIPTQCLSGGDKHWWGSHSRIVFLTTWTLLLLSSLSRLGQSYLCSYLNYYNQGQSTCFFKLWSVLPFTEMRLMVHFCIFLLIAFPVPSFPCLLFLLHVCVCGCM